MYIGVDVVGLAIILETGQTITGASNIVLHVKKPSGKRLTWSGAVVYGTTQIKYTSEAGDLDEAGWYTVYPTLTVGGFQGTGKPTKFQVQDPLKPEILYNR